MRSATVLSAAAFALGFSLFQWAQEAYFFLWKPDPSNPPFSASLLLIAMVVPLVIAAVVGASFGFGLVKGGRTGSGYRSLFVVAGLLFVALTMGVVRLVTAAGLPLSGGLVLLWQVVVPAVISYSLCRVLPRGKHDG